MSATCPNCSKKLSYKDLVPFMDNMSQSNEYSFEMNEHCPKCQKEIVFKKDGGKYLMKEANGDFVMIGHK